MKTINITKKRGNNSPLDFALGNGKRLQFTSKRLANKFIADTNRYLTKCLVVLNLTYMDVFREYRLLWFVGSNSNNGNTTNYRNIEQSIKSNLQTADFMFDKFNFADSGSSDPFFSFIDLRKAAMFLQQAADTMASFHKKRNNTAAYYNCIVLADRCQAVMNKLDDYDYVN
ncbi:MAG: hypothetical protein ABIQ88_02440 [Chitinophagaceae bacterium]